MTPTHYWPATGRFVSALGRSQSKIMGPVIKFRDGTRIEKIQAKASQPIKGNRGLERKLRNQMKKGNL